MSHLNFSINVIRLS